MGYCGKVFGVRGSVLLAERQKKYKKLLIMVKTISCFFTTSLNSPSLQKASRSNPHPTFSNCRRNDVTSVWLCLTTFRKKQLYTTKWHTRIWTPLLITSRASELGTPPMAKQDLISRKPSAFKYETKYSMFSCICGTTSTFKFVEWKQGWVIFIFHYELLWYVAVS